MRRFVCLALVAVASSCSQGLKVVRWVGAPSVDIGDPQQVFLAEVKGTESAVDMVTQELKRGLTDRMGAKLAPGPAEGVAVVSATVERWSQPVMGMGQGVAGANVQTVQLTERMQVVFTVKRADGGDVTRDYAQTQSDAPREARGVTSTSDDRMAQMNAHAIVGQFLDEVLPKKVSEPARFVEGPELSEGLSLVSKGDLEGAEAAWRTLDSAGAHHNVGLLLEIRQDLDGARAEYEAAVSRSSDPRYRQALDTLEKSASLRPRALRR